MRVHSSSFLGFLITAAIVLAAVNCSTSVLHLERTPLPLNSSAALRQLRAQDRARHARLFDGVANFSVYGSADTELYGIYFTKVKLGSPPQEFSLQIDTGSDLLWVNAKSCSNCPRSSGLGLLLLFSNTNFKCAFLCSRMGLDFIRPDSTVATSSAAITFGVSTYHSGPSVDSALAVDGIFGLGQGPSSAISQLASGGVIPPVFSHCLKGEGLGGGTFVLGEISEPGMVYTPLVPAQPHYNLYLQSIAVNGELLPVDPAVFMTSTGRGTFVDSGTTLAYLVEEAYEPFISAV
ncbi:unnamed protein product [Linum tenue]|uniref:Peptidase A1 domain-containing protein n=1 Tax=Linum tenue TaxID=586396 RepID=A0AAV0RWQ3_9ROSI|nr:unnamed protein product [Linum tenue]